MIGRIRGLLVEKMPGHLIIECGGLGYEVEIPYTTFFQLPEPGSEVLLHTHFVVREDAQSLFGFFQKLDRDLFRLLIRVNGVGPKLAVAILSGLSADQFILCVQNKDVNALVKLPGIGKKTAERLLIEVSDRLGQLEHEFQPSPAPTTKPQVSASDARGEAEAALIALGYKPQEATRAIERASVEGSTREDLIRLALRSMIPVS